ncbi:RagB/SusD family nutrient uptake outer membrane protein [Christiangramia fulva]|uniref:RagB/SusD family nutrient uptake outer membrane protein n=1 Tax=Christiangramia fulva TaxID=2126553 RepID=A0A2R3Z5Q4_9FLAO|nr:RagB/SusD family nutrient uptake outer membrane protein [Christiangramia fulva]AVR45606.1 RagB/SusD family nutrient uptake outer membrane protein [Christiangramia fulva]
MRTNKIKISLIAFFIAIFFSCDNYLNLEPEDGTVRQEFWKTKEDVQAAVIGCYNSMLNSPPGVSDRPLTDYLFMYGELRADMVLPTEYASNDERDITRMNILETNPITNWSAFYRVINYCNTILEFAPDVLEKDPTFTQKELDGFMAEALAIRSYLYFTLARTFRDVPLKLNATLSDTDNFQIPQSTQAEIFEQVAGDLEQAATMAKKTYGNNAQDKGRITQSAINAMLADVYLWMEDYQNAVKAADKVINTGDFALIPANNSWFNTVYAEGNSSESIFELQYSLNNLNPFYDMFLERPRYTASARVMEEVFGINFQDPTKKDIRGNRCSLVATNGYIYKYVGLTQYERKSRGTSDTHWFLYRYADVLLMKAEALNQLGMGEQALDLIHQVRERAEALEMTERNPTDKDGITDYILEERAREFAFEGKRWFDVLRNAKRNNYERIDLLLTMAAYSAPSDLQQSILAKLRDPNSHYLPIYYYELYANKALEQNPFYE